MTLSSFRPGFFLFLAGLGMPACTDSRPRLDVAFICGGDECSGNSPIVYGMPFSEANDDGVTFNENGTGLRVLHISKNNKIYKLDVLNDRLRGLPRPPGPPILEGPALTDATIVLETTGGEKVYVKIFGVQNTVKFRAGPETPVMTYRLKWSTVPNSPPYDFVEVCPEMGPTHDYGDAYRSVIFFEGDRYDPVAKRVTAIGRDAGTKWFNVSCAASAPFKLYLIRHTTASAQGPFVATLEERQIALNMFTANYCGTGRAFTVVGQPLRWQNAPGWNGPDSHDLDEFPDGGVPWYESVWTKQGAACLDEPRMGFAPGEDPDEWKAAIDSECDGGPPPCSDLAGFPAAWKNAGYMLSTSP